MIASSNQRIKDAFIEGLGIAESENWETLAYGQHENWDSVAHMNLVACVENEFDIMLETDDVIGMSSFLVALEILKKYGVEVA